MNKKEALRELEANGSARTRKTYARHGIKGKMFGVSYAVLGKLSKKIGVDHALAEELWASGIFDARVLATMIADPSRLTRKTADAWVKDYDHHGLVDALAGLVARSPAAAKLMEKWGKARSEWIAATGWSLLCHLAKLDRELPDSFFAEKLDVIEAEIHGRKNRVRSSMNWWRLPPRLAPSV
ncbi:MAG: DNA alkylation repair protein, partial [Planctomycetota bacterium]